MSWRCSPLACATAKGVARSRRARRPLPVTGLFEVQQKPCQGASPARRKHPETVAALFSMRLAGTSKVRVKYHLVRRREREATPRGHQELRERQVLELPQNCPSCGRATRDPSSSPSSQLDREWVRSAHNLRGRTSGHVRRARSSRESEIHGQARRTSCSWPEPRCRYCVHQRPTSCLCLRAGQEVTVANADLDPTPLLHATLETPVVLAAVTGSRSRSSSASSFDYDKLPPPAGHAVRRAAVQRLRRTDDP